MEEMGSRWLEEASWRVGVIGSAIETTEVGKLSGAGAGAARARMAAVVRYILGDGLR